MEKIVLIGKERYEQQQAQLIDFVDDKKTNDLLNDIENNPHVFVLACLMQRQINYKKAWTIPQKIFDILGTYEIEKLSLHSAEEYVKLFRDNNLHRFNVNMALTFHHAVLDIKNKYHSNVSVIWKNEPSSATVVYHFLQFKGCGIKIATMAANILARAFKIKFSDYYSIDISPDVHVLRVMKRMGYIPENNREMVIYKARELNPEFPGIIDFSCWEIGRKYCRPTNPKCDICIVKNECKKLI